MYSIKWLAVILVLTVSQLCFAQYKSWTIPLELNNYQLKSKHDIGIKASEFIGSDFIAVSLRIEGNDKQVQNCTFTLDVNDITYTFVKSHEWDGDDQTIFVSDIIYLPATKADYWHLKAISSDKSEYKIDAKGFLRVFVPEDNITPNEKPSRPESTSERADCLCPLPDYIGRSNWGSTFNLNADIFTPPAAYTTVTHLIVHHSAGTNTSNNWKGVVASIFDAHVHTNGWQDIGYNWLIDPNGVLYEGRGGGDNVRGAHMCGYNNNTLGVCLLGNFEIASPTSSMLAKLKELLAYKACKESITADGDSDIVSYPGHMHHISGHKDGCSPNYTSCPGINLYTKLDSMRLETKRQISTVCLAPVKTLNITDEKSLIYPVPASDYICSNAFEISHFTNTYGIEFSSFLKRKDENCYDISAIPSGLYFVQLTGQTLTYRLYKM